MAFPNSFTQNIVSGLVGEIALDSARIVNPAVLASAAEANNVFGRAFTYTDEANETVGAGGTGQFAGILVNPKELAIGAQTVANGRSAGFLRQGHVFCDFGATAVTIGDLVFFTNTTGALGAGTATTGQTQIAGARVVWHNGSATASGNVLAIVEFNA